MPQNTVLIASKALATPPPAIHIYMASLPDIIIDTNTQRQTPRRANPSFYQGHR
jgi:hypothetical protein